MSIIQVRSVAEIEQYKSSHKGVALLFTMEGCGPCVQLAPYYEQLPAQYPNVKFLRVKINENADIHAHYGVNRFPHFKAFMNGQQKFEFVGFQAQYLKDVINYVNYYSR